MKNIKCSQCGGTEFFQSDRHILQDEWTSISPFDGSYGTYAPTVDVYVCESCGHVEIFVCDELKKKREDDIKRQKRKKVFEQGKKSQIERLEKEIEELEKIIVDDSNSVKLVNESKEKLVQVKEQLKKVKSSEFEEKVGTDISGL